VLFVVGVFLLFTPGVSCDAPRAWGLYFQDSASPQMEAIVELHDNIMFYLVAILLAVGWLQAAIIRNFDSSKSPISLKYLKHGTLIELIWTITPALILVLIAFPSFKLLYLMDEVTDPSMSVLAEGNLDGPKSYTLYKNEDMIALAVKNINMLAFPIIGKRNNTIKSLCLNQMKTLTLNRMFYNRVKAPSRIGPHDWDVISVIVGSLLGLNKRKYCSNHIDLFKDNKLQYRLHPNWITGFTDAEETFIISILKSKDRALNWKVTPIFAIELHGKDINLLQIIKLFFGVGNIIISKRNGHAIYSVKSAKDIYSSIIPHFKNYPLFTQKQADFILFTNIVELIIQKQHLSEEGLIKIIALWASINKGLSSELSKSFANIKPIARPVVLLPGNFNMFWFTGFIDGDGSFFINITKGKTKIGYVISLNFNVTQHICDSVLFHFIRKGLGCGIVFEIRKDNRVNIVVNKFTDITNIIIPQRSRLSLRDVVSKTPRIFDKHYLQSTKLYDFKDFRLAADLIEKKEHLTIKGLEKMREIKSGMNTGRQHSGLSIENSNIKTNLFIAQKRSFHTNVKAINRIGPHNSDIISVIVGSLLGKAKVIRSIGGTRLCYRQSSLHKEYLFWQYNFYLTRRYCSNSQPRLYKRELKNKGGDNKIYFGYEFYTYYFRSFNWIHKMFYHKGKKVLKMESKYFTPLSLAVFCMSSGKYINNKIELSTKFNKESDIDKLVNILINCFGIYCNKKKCLGRKEFYTIIIPKKSVKLLQAIVLPHIPCNIYSKLFYGHSHRVSLGSGFKRLSSFIKNSKGYSNKRGLHTINKANTKISLNPFWITGFADGEAKLISQYWSLKVNH